MHPLFGNRCRSHATTGGTQGIPNTYRTTPTPRARASLLGSKPSSTTGLCPHERSPAVLVQDKSVTLQTLPTTAKEKLPRYPCCLCLHPTYPILLISTALSSGTTLPKVPGKEVLPAHLAAQLLQNLESAQNRQI